MYSLCMVKVIYTKYTPYAIAGTYSMNIHGHCIVASYLRTWAHLHCAIILKENRLQICLCRAVEVSARQFSFICLHFSVDYSQDEWSH